MEINILEKLGMGSHTGKEHSQISMVKSILESFKTELCVATSLWSTRVVIRMKEESMEMAREMVQGTSHGPQALSIRVIGWMGTNMAMESRRGDQAHTPGGLVIGMSESLETMLEQVKELTTGTMEMFTEEDTRMIHSMGLES